MNLFARFVDAADNFAEPKPRGKRNCNIAFGSSAPYCRSVGLHSMEAHRVVRALCDVRGIPRRYFWGYPTWQTSTPQPVTVRSRKEVVRPRQDDASTHLPREPRPPIICTCTECGEGFASTRKASYCGVACRVRHCERGNDGDED
jgi:hypothetical protein